MERDMKKSYPFFVLFIELFLRRKRKKGLDPFFFRTIPLGVGPVKLGCLLAVDLFIRSFV
jgi:hypothetical protein